MFWKTEETKEEEMAHCHPDDRALAIDRGSKDAGHLLEGHPPSSMQKAPRSPGRAPQPAPRPPYTHSAPPPAAGTFILTGLPPSPSCAGPPAKFGRPTAFLWEDAGLSSCSLAMIKVRLVPKKPFHFIPLSLLLQTRWQPCIFSCN